MSDPDITPTGDPPVREQLQGDAEPMPSELESRLDEVEAQDVGAPGDDAFSEPPEPAYQGQDEGPTAEGGGQGLEGAGGGGR